jgi:hypothetical protein
MAEKIIQSCQTFGKYRPRGLGEYPDEKEGYLGCDQNVADVA